MPQFDKGNMFAEDTTLASPSHAVIDIGEDGIGSISDYYFFVKMTAAATGLTSANFALHTADDEAGTINKTQIMATPEYDAAKLTKGFLAQFELPPTKQRYLILETNVTGTATGGTYWSGLTTGRQNSWHN